MATIKITQLPNIGNALTASTVLPVVNTTGTATTDKTTVGAIANYALLQAGNTLRPAFLSTLAYSVVNAAQPNITSVGTLNINTLHISGGTNGYVLQTDGGGNLSWSAMAGSGVGNPGGSNTQIQFNDGGLFGGNPALTFDTTNNTLGTVNIQASSATIYDTLTTSNVISENIHTNNFTTTTFTTSGNIEAPFFIGDGSQLTGITATASGAGPDTSIQFNNNGIFAGDGNLTWDSANAALNTVTVNAETIYGNLTANTVDAEYLIGDGSNITNIGNVNYANSANLSNTAGVANSVAVANVVGIGNIAVLSLSGNASSVLYGNGVFAELPNTISNANYATYSETANTANSIAVANVSGLGNIATTNFDGNASNILYGNGVFANAPTGSNYGDSNVESLLSSYGSNTITTTGNVSVGNIIGNGQSLTGITGANVTGQVSYAAIANSVAVANVTGIGNIATINKDGNASNILYGNGVFADKPSYTPAGSNTQLQFNDANSFGATANLTFDKTTNTLDVNGPVVAGVGSSLGGLTNPVISGTGNVDNYLQIDNWNASNTANASSDFIAYPNNGTDASGWIDVGITSNAFSQAAFSVTAQNEGYVFMSAPSGSGRSGNLVIATDSTGANNSIEFYVGGFNQTKNGTTRKLLITSAGANVTGNLNVSVDVLATGNLWSNSGVLRTTSTTANVFNSNATTVNIAGAASLAVNIGNSSGTVNLSGNVQGNTNGFAIGYRDIPQISLAANATTALTDAGKHYYSTSSSNLVLTVANSAVANYSTGATINIINQGTGNITVAQGSGVTIYMAGNSTSGNRTLSSYGVASITKVATDTWFLSGVGLT